MSNLEDLEDRLDDCPDAITRDSNPLRDIAREAIAALRESEARRFGLYDWELLSKDNARLRAAIEKFLAAPKETMPFWAAYKDLSKALEGEAGEPRSHCP